MKPEVRKQLEENTLPFGEMSRELQEAFVIALVLDRLPALKVMKEEGSEDVTVPLSLILHNCHTYRLAPEPKREPQYPWSMLRPEIKWCAIDWNGGVFGYSEKPSKEDLTFGIFNCNGTVGGWCLNALTFDRGNIPWQETLRQRPEGV